MAGFPGRSFYAFAETDCTEVGKGIVMNYN